MGDPNGTETARHQLFVEGDPYRGHEAVQAGEGRHECMAAHRESKDPSLYTVVLEDSAAMLGLVFAFLVIFLGHLFNRMRIPTAWHPSLSACC